MIQSPPSKWNRINWPIIKLFNRRFVDQRLWLSRSIEFNLVSCSIGCAAAACSDRLKMSSCVVVFNGNVDKHTCHEHSRMCRANVCLTTNDRYWSTASTTFTCFCYFYFIFGCRLENSQMPIINMPVDFVTIPIQSRIFWPFYVSVCSTVVYACERWSALYKSLTVIETIL